MIHSCIEVEIRDATAMNVDMHCPCCNNPVDIHSVECEHSVSIRDYGNISCSLEWVCGVGFSERYLCGSDSELITVDGNYLVVIHKPKA